MRESALKTQKIFAFTFSMLLFITVVLNIATLIRRYPSLSIYEIFKQPEIILNAICCVLFSLTWKNSILIRYFQCILLLMEGYTALIINNVDSFWGWGLVLISVMLFTYYELWEKHFLVKAICFIVSFIFIISISSLINKRPEMIFASLIYFLFISTFSVIIFRDSIIILLEQKYDYKNLSEELELRRAEVRDLSNELCTQKAFLENEVKQHEISIRNKIDSDYIESLQRNKALEQELEEVQKQKEWLMERNSQLQAMIDEKNKTLIADEEKIAARIRENDILSKLAPAEQDLIILFYQSRGTLDTDTIADKMYKAPSTIKNTFRSIYQKLGIHSRSALISLIDDLIR